MGAAVALTPLMLLVLAFCTASAVALKFDGLSRPQIQVKWQSYSRHRFNVLDGDYRPLLRNSRFLRPAATQRHNHSYRALLE
jgi:hypothetical protein